MKAIYSLNIFSLAMFYKLTIFLLTERTILWYMTFWGFAMNYMLRMNLNIAIVSMVKTIPKHVNVTKFSQCNTEFLNSTLSIVNKKSDQKVSSKIILINVIIFYFYVYT